MNQQQQQGFELNRAPLLVAAIVVAAGALVAFVGVSIGARAAVTEGRRYLGAMDPPLNEFAKAHLGRLRAVGAAVGTAGAEAWQKTAADVPSLKSN